MSMILFLEGLTISALWVFLAQKQCPKKGTMDSYETTTTGKAFEALFDETKWKAFESKKG